MSTTSYERRRGYQVRLQKFRNMIHIEIIIRRNILEKS